MAWRGSELAVSPAKEHVFERIRALNQVQGLAAGFRAAELFASPPHARHQESDPVSVQLGKALIYSPAVA